MTLGSGTITEYAYLKYSKQSIERLEAEYRCRTDARCPPANNSARASEPVARRAFVPTVTLDLDRRRRGSKRRTDKAANLRQLTDKLKQDEPVDPPEEDPFVIKKPESRTIVGSYYQRSIPFRSASFSHVYYSPEDRKYVRNARKPVRRNSPLTVDSATLPRVGTSLMSITDEVNIEPTIGTLNNASTSIKIPVVNVALTTSTQPVNIQSEVEESLIDKEPALPLKASITPINAPQPPKRTKHKHKHRNKHSSRIFFSDENIFVQNEKQKTDRVESISLTITTPNGSDTEENLSSPIVDVSFDDNVPQLPIDEDLEVTAVASEVETIPEDAGHIAENTVEQVEVTADEVSEINDNETNVKNNVNEEPYETNFASDHCPNEINHEDSASGSENLSTAKPDENEKKQDAHPFTIYPSPSSPEDLSIRPTWPRPQLTPQTSIERDDDSNETIPRPKTFGRGDSFSEAESESDKRSVSPSTKERLSPLQGYYESDSETRSRGQQSPIPYSKRPLRGPYLEMIVGLNEKKPDKTQNFTWTLNNRTVDDYHLYRNMANVPKRKISANIPFISPSSRTAPEEKPIHHQRTTSSPSQLEYYPDQMIQPPPSQQLLHQLLRGSSERCLIPDTDHLNALYSSSPYKDTRSHIVVELYDTERSYVESLQILVTKYLQPLKSPEFAGLVEPYVVQEIFYQVPELLTYHEVFLEELRIRLEGWNKSKCIGDIFLETFTKESVVESYIAFINNWKTAKEAIKQTCHSKPAFARFLEAMAKEHKGKLALDSLLIMPVQRIPRYELLVQSLIKHTEPCHPDHDKLQEAQRQVHELAVRINCTERDSLELEQIENLIDGLGNLVSADRQFLRYDMVTMTSGQGLNRKDRALFLFNDLLIITSMKRRSSTVKKPIIPGSFASSLEANKYKLLMKIPLEHLDIVKVKDENLRRMMKEMEYLSEDVSTLSQMSDLVSTLHCPHGQLEDMIRDVLSALNKQLSERHVSESQLSYLEFAINTRNSVENISVIFPKPEKRTCWEETFLEAKNRLNLSDDRRMCPEFLTSVPIRKTRAGLQFTCAAAAYNQKDVWVCNSDGYVGQVCVLSLQPEPTVTSCNGVCNARILSVASVPVSRIMEKGNADLSENSIKAESYENINEHIPVESSGRDIPDIHLDSSSSSEDDDDTDDALDENENTNGDSDASMWLGTEDGVIHIYNCADSLRVKRNKLKIQHNSAVYCILYLDRNVFVSLANGEIHVYSWSASSCWNTNEAITISVGCATTPVSKMFIVGGKLWCICHNVIKILNVNTFNIENSFTINGEYNRAITSVAVSGFSVWLSLQNSAVLRLVHSVTFEVLADVNVAPAVTKMLSGSDDIIRQHKTACLRVTSLLACKDLLWIGTSAGVILTMTMPIVKLDTNKINTIPHPTGVPHGHTGHVRFLTAVKSRPEFDTSRRSSKIANKRSKPSDGLRMLVISGGDGYEDFRSSSISEIAGREDSTNHLLIWRV